MSKILFSCLIANLIAFTVATKPVTDDEADKYLRNFGYMQDDTDGSLSSLSDRGAAISEFQRMAGINVTGKLNDETREYMQKSRCGVADNVGFKRSASGRRSKRYVLQGSRWSSTRLSYRFLNYSPDLPQQDSRSEIQRAFQRWADNSKLEFRETSSTPDIDILFARGEHGDRNAFDGPGGTLAHAYFPTTASIGGDAHFDEDETFSTTSRGINLHQVATHEFGHSLGLGHSDVRGAVMYPFYQYVSDFNLHPDDIAGIQALYGANEVATTRPPVPTTTRSTSSSSSRPSATSFPTRPVVTSSSTTRRPVTSTTRPNPPNPDYCNNGQVDAALLHNGVTYFFQGEYYYQLGSSGVANGFPKRIDAADSIFRGVPSNIDAAVTWPALYQWTYSSSRWQYKQTKPARTFIFKGSQYWKFDENLSQDSNNPGSISGGFPGIPNDLDAAFVWSGNHQFYFMKGSQYYRYISGYGVPSGYPRPLSHWRELPKKIDAALQYSNSRTYFFSGQDYYRFNDYTASVDRAYPSYPRSTTQWWFGCSQLGSLSDMEMKDQMDDDIVLNNIKTQEMKDMSGSAHVTASWAVITSLICVFVVLLW